MAGLTLQEISDYNNRNAFTRLRTDSIRATKSFIESVAASNNRNIKTASLTESYSLLSGLADRIEMIRSNLSTMAEYAQLGASATNQTDRDEYIGYLRSLSGGIDDIVDNTVWNDQKTLDGRTLDISLTRQGTGASKKIVLNTFYSSDEDGLDLTNQPASGKADVYYDYYAAYRNQQAGVVGLDITEGMASEVSPIRKELETGTYRLEISYAGPDSTISIKNMTGGLINKVEGVDLSGTGQELVDLEVGVTLSINKEQILKSVDKYDYENEGPATLYAVMDYERVFRHELSLDGFSQYSERELETSYKKRISDGANGSMEIESLNMAGVPSDTTGLASGNYSLRVNYRGENSSVEIWDSKGRMQYLNHKVDLTGSEKVKIDTGKGISFTIDNNGFTGESGQMMALFSYTAETNNNEDFDFSEYAQKIQDAIGRLDQDWETVLDAQDEILQLNNLLNGSYSSSTATSSASLVTSLISGSIDSTASSIFNYSSANAGLSAVADELFQGTSAAMSVQANIHAARVAKVFSA
jgi:hypothetical protein